MTYIAKWLCVMQPNGFEIDNNCDRSTGVECPRPQCSRIVYYNGNYFCGCGWAAEPTGEETSAESIKFCALLLEELLIQRGVIERPVLV